jgi:hypothetical protein
MEKTLADVVTDPLVFLNDLFSKIEDIDLNVDPYELDHICYRVETNNEYQQKKLDLAPFGDLLVESMVNGRLISTFKLHQPILFRERKIYLLELPSPKSQHSYHSGFEHAEFVTKDPLQKIVDRYPQYSFEVFGIHKKINADITLKLGDYCIRFHNQNLEQVIQQELRHNKAHK